MSWCWDNKYITSTVISFYWLKHRPISQTEQTFATLQDFVLFVVVHETAVYNNMRKDLVNTIFLPSCLFY